MAAITAARHVTVALADKAMAQAIGVSGGKQEGDRQHVQLARVSVGRYVAGWRAIHYEYIDHNISYRSIV